MQTRTSRNALPLVCAALAALLGARVGYATAGIGGGMLFAAAAALGGILLGRLVRDTMRVASTAWPVVALLAVFVILIVLTWNLRF
jgi:ABC-type uncharacterized transport system permease subunit